MRVIAIFSFIQEPAIRPDLGRPEDLPPGPQDDPHRFVVEYKWKAGHTGELCNQPATGTHQ